MTRPTTQPARTRRLLALGAAALTIAATAIVTPGTAVADAGFAPTVSPTTGLDPAGDTVAVTLTGLPADQGVYVRLCAQPQPGTRPAAATCDGSGVWAVETYPYGPAPTDGSVVKPSDGPVTLPVRASFAGIDCTTVTCGVFTRRDHPGGSTDLALDTFTPLAFTVTPPVDPEPEPEPEPVAFDVEVGTTTGVIPGSPVAVTVTGVPSDQGVYVRWCVQTAAGVRPTAEQCDGQGVWALETYPYGPRPTDGTVADPTAGPITLPTKASIGSIDCTTTVCGVSTRRDHRGPADTSMDTFTAVALAVPPVEEPVDEDDETNNGSGDGSSTDDGTTTDPQTDPVSNPSSESAGGTGTDDANGGTAAASLPATGAASLDLLPWAAAMLLVGGSMVAFARRKTPAATR